MKKILFLIFLLPFTACRKNAGMPGPVPSTPDITETLSLSIVNQNPDGYDSARGHVSDTFSWSIPHAYSDGMVFTTVGLTIGFPSDTTNLSLGYQYTGTSGGDATFTDTIAANRPYGIGLSRMLNWWRGDAIPVNDTVTNDNVDINTNPLELTADDTLTFTNKAYVGDELIGSGTFSERLYTELAYTYKGSFCRKTWYVKGTFSNMIWVFTPD